MWQPRKMKGGSMNKMAYFKNVLSYNKGETTILVLGKPSQEDVEEIKYRRDIKFLLACDDIGVNGGNILYKKIDLSPSSLKNINYCLYRGDDMEIKQAILFSGITLVYSLNDIDFDKKQTSIERINNFELGSIIA